MEKASETRYPGAETPAIIVVDNTKAPRRNICKSVFILFFHVLDRYVVDCEEGSSAFDLSCKGVSPLACHGGYFILGLFAHQPIMGKSGVLSNILECSYGYLR